MKRFRILPERSRVETEMTSNVHPIHATANDLSGAIEGEVGPDGLPDFGAPHRAHLRLAVEGMVSGNRLQDMEMQRRMEARTYPTIEVTIERAWLPGGDGQPRASFEVSACGRSRSYEENFSVRVDGRRLIVEGEHAFDMRDFGVSPPRFLALKVNPEVRVRVRLEAEEEVSDGAEAGARA